MLIVNTYISSSEIEGVGVFASEPIASGTQVWQPDPDFDMLISRSRYEASPAHLKLLFDRYAYPSEDRPGNLVYEADNGRFMNHADAPNTDFSRHGGGFATADIAAGQEITCDYGEFYKGFDPLLHASA